MEAFLVSTGIVTLAEMGDKTQLLALILAARYQRPWPIVLGIFVATVFNHALAGALGAWITTLLGPQVLRWILGASFIAMAVWMLVPDRADDGAARAPGRLGVFGTTLVAFFLVEMGDKTQLATVALAWMANVAALGGGAVGRTALAIGVAKAGLPLGEAFARGILCNALVCLAVWLTLGARSVGEVVLVTDFAGWQLSARNQLAGTVSRIERGAVSSLVVLTLPGGAAITASVTNEGVQALALQVGAPATAVFKAYSVMVAAQP